MTRALALAEAVIVTPTFYLQPPLAATFGFFLFGYMPEIWLIPGAALIIGGSYYRPGARHAAAPETKMAPMTAGVLLFRRMACWG